MQHSQPTQNNVTPNEKRAVEIANSCKKFISLIRKINSNASLQNMHSVSSEYDSLKKNVLEMLNIIQAESIREHLKEVLNYYYLYFLQQITRFNQYFHKIDQIKDLRKNNRDALAQNIPPLGFNNLIKNFKSFEHPLLPSLTKVTMTITVNRNDGIFRNAYKVDDEGIRYYYNRRSTPNNQPHQDRTHYFTANKNIGLATQGSNFSSLFRPDSLGQATHAYFKHADKELHQTELALFRSARHKIKNALPLDNNEKNVLLSGKYYRYNSPVKFNIPNNSPVDRSNGALTNDHLDNNRNYQITHIGHAAEFISLQNTLPLNICIDPVHYQSGTGGIISGPAKVLYGRKTDPAFATDEYPFVHIVLLSHNHYDHMCEKSIKEAFGESNTLFIVPVGDAKYIKKFGLTNVIELSSWNDSLTISLRDRKGNASNYEIRCFPANHASNRSTTDFYASLYTGYMIRDLNTNHVILCTGDTAVIDQTHFQQLQDYLLNNNLTISTACIAHGPDRPRQWMKCTHQSTADALTMHAEFNVMNAFVYAKTNKLQQLSFEDIKKSACYAIGYHQGCYRLGLLSISDVDTTLLRTLSVLALLGDTPVKNITQPLLDKNIFFHFMDQFEQDALLNTIDAYNKLGSILGSPLKANNLIELITSHLNVPQPGYRADFSKNEPYDGFVFDYSRMILNKYPLNIRNANQLGAFEYFIERLNPKYYDNFDDDSKYLDLIRDVFEIYLQRPMPNILKNDHKDSVRQFMNDLCKNQLSVNEMSEALGKFYAKVHPKQDEGLRDEGHLHTAILIIAGLFYFPSFRYHIKAYEIGALKPIQEFFTKASKLPDGLFFPSEPTHIILNELTAQDVINIRSTSK